MIKKMATFIPLYEAPNHTGGPKYVSVRGRVLLAGTLKTKVCEAIFSFSGKHRQEMWMQVNMRYIPKV